MEYPGNFESCFNDKPIYNDELEEERNIHFYEACKEHLFSDNSRITTTETKESSNSSNFSNSLETNPEYEDKQIFNEVPNVSKKSETSDEK